MKIGAEPRRDCSCRPSWLPVQGAGQVSWPPVVDSRGRHRSDSWPSLVRISWPPTHHSEAAARPPTSRHLNLRQPIWARDQLQASPACPARGVEPLPVNLSSCGGGPEGRGSAANVEPQGPETTPVAFHSSAVTVLTRVTSVPLSAIASRNPNRPNAQRVTASHACTLARPSHPSVSAAPMVSTVA